MHLHMWSTYLHKFTTDEIQRETVCRFSCRVLVIKAKVAHLHKLAAVADEISNIFFVLSENAADCPMKYYTRGLFWVKLWILNTRN